jgi:hypothetical protein
MCTAAAADEHLADAEALVMAAARRHGRIGEQVRHTRPKRGRRAGDLTREHR